MDPRVTESNAIPPNDLDTFEVWDQYDEGDDLTDTSHEKSKETQKPSTSSSSKESDGITALSKVVSALRDQSHVHGGSETTVEKAVNHILHSIQSGLMNFTETGAPAASTSRGTGNKSNSSEMEGNTSENLSKDRPYQESSNDDYSSKGRHESSNDGYWPGRGRGRRGGRGGGYPPRNDRGADRSDQQSGSEWRENRWERGGRGRGYRGWRGRGGWNSNSSNDYTDAYNRKRGAPTFGMTHSDAKYGRFDEAKDSNDPSYPQTYADYQAICAAREGKSFHRQGPYREREAVPSSSWRRRPHTRKDYENLKKEHLEMKQRNDKLTEDLQRVRKFRADLLMMHRDQRDPQVRKCSTLETDLGRQTSDLNRQITTEERWLMDFISNYSNPSELTEEESKPFHVFSDEGSHWCRFCSHSSTDLAEFLEHLQSDVHESNTQDETIIPDVDEKRRPEDKVDCGPMHGSEFLSYAVGFYCTLCKEFVGGETTATKHMSGKPHEDKYKELTERQPFYTELFELERYVSTEKRRETIRRDKDRIRMETLVAHHSAGAVPGRIPLKKGSKLAQKREQMEKELEDERRRKKLKEKERDKEKEKEAKEKKEKERDENSDSSLSEPESTKSSSVKKFASRRKRFSGNTSEGEPNLESDDSRRKKSKNHEISQDSRKSRLSRETLEEDEKPKSRKLIDQEATKRKKDRKRLLDSSDDEISEVDSETTKVQSEAKNNTKKTDDSRSKETTNKRQKRNIIDDDSDDESEDEIMGLQSKMTNRKQIDDDEESENEEAEQVLPNEEPKAVENHENLKEASSYSAAKNSSVGEESDENRLSIDLEIEIVDEVCNDDGLTVIGEDFAVVGEEEPEDIHLEEPITPGKEKQEIHREDKEEIRRKEREETRRKEKEEIRRKEKELEESAERERKERERHEKKDKERREREKMRKEIEEEEERRKARREAKRKEKEKKKKPTLEETVEIFRHLSDGKSTISSPVQPKYKLRPCCVRLRRLNLAKHPRLKKQLDDIQRSKNRSRSSSTDERPKKSLKKNNAEGKQVKTPALVADINDSLSSLSSDSDDDSPLIKKKEFSKKVESKTKTLLDRNDLPDSSNLVVPNASCSKKPEVQPLKEENSKMDRVENVWSKLQVDAGVNLAELMNESESKNKITNDQAINGERKEKDAKELDEEDEIHDGLVICENENIASSLVEVAENDKIENAEVTGEKCENKKVESGEIAEEKIKNEKIESAEIETKEEEITCVENLDEHAKESDTIKKGGTDSTSTKIQVPNANTSESADSGEDDDDTTLTKIETPKILTESEKSPKDGDSSVPLPPHSTDVSEQGIVASSPASQVVSDDNVMNLDFSSDIESVDDFVVEAKVAVNKFLQEGKNLSSTDSDSDSNLDSDSDSD